MDSITFKSNSLQTANIIISEIDHDNPPEQEVQIYQLTHGNKSIYLPDGYSGKKINVKGMLQADTIADFDQLLDEFKGYFTGGAGYLDIGYGGSTRRYYAKAIPPKLPRPGGLMYSTFTMQFICLIPFGFDTTYTELANVTGETSVPSTTSLTLGGNAEFQYPIVEITINTATNTTNATVTVSNNNNGQVLSIMRTSWSNGDVIYIDPYEQDVKVNGVEVPFTGAIPIFNKGAGSISISDNFNTRNIDYTVNQLRYWL